MKAAFTVDSLRKGVVALQEAKVKAREHTRNMATRLSRIQKLEVARAKENGHMTTNECAGNALLESLKLGNALTGAASG